MCLASPWLRHFQKGGSAVACSLGPRLRLLSVVFISTDKTIFVVPKNTTYLPTNIQKKISLPEEPNILRVTPQGTVLKTSDVTVADSADEVSKLVNVSLKWNLNKTRAHNRSSNFSSCMGKSLLQHDRNSEKYSSFLYSVTVDAIHPVKYRGFISDRTIQAFIHLAIQDSPFIFPLMCINFIHSVELDEAFAFCRTGKLARKNYVEFNLFCTCLA